MNDDVVSWSGSFLQLAYDDQYAVAQLVKNGKAVVGTVEQILARLERTRCITVLRETNTNIIVAAAALKQPASIYRVDNFTKAGVQISGFEVAPELGYVVVDPDMQGKKLSGRLVSVIVEKINEPTFATTDSITMHNNLARAGFNRVGDEWQGKKGKLSLWIITP
ncbi:hypothetical protein [Roseovarius sp. ZX-A-9]|uniref:hypothetical protein n=1 Tax=Roseovarius sp. ZX-A-9 TaxID=3014783 RepID=UPI00232FFF1A|nr:hypothetical protein [Roseovarius sp. ZX-A-9]